ncbi:MAG: hypothetical protein ACC657_04835 [Thiohalomonadales bacterium]
MKHKSQLKLIVALFMSVIFTVPFSVTVFAEEGTYGELKSALKDVRALYHADKAEIIIDELKMTKEENKAFWPVYNSYTTELKGVGDKMIKLISGYADNQKKMTDKYADKMVNDYLDIQDAQLKIQEKYIPKFKKVLSIKKVARLYQIENKLNAVNDLELAASVPMIK